MFMHYAFDLWMARNHPGWPFERYADAVAVVVIRARRVGCSEVPASRIVRHLRRGRVRAAGRGR